MAGSSEALSHMSSSLTTLARIPLSPCFNICGLYHVGTSHGKHISTTNTYICYIDIHDLLDIYVCMYMYVYICCSQHVPAGYPAMHDTPHRGAFCERFALLLQLLAAEQNFASVLLLLVLPWHVQRAEGKGQPSGHRG